MSPTDPFVPLLLDAGPVVLESAGNGQRPATGPPAGPAVGPDRLTRGLLTAAVYHFRRGDDRLVRSALDEAQQIAERGAMPLRLADVHLHRARLFRDRTELAKARALIEKHGYWRRKEELEDAEEVAKNWPASDEKGDSVH